MALGQVFGDRQRVPDNGVAVVQAGHVARWRIGGVRRVGSDALQLYENFAKRRARQLGREPSPQRPRRIILVADVERIHSEVTSG